MLRILQFLRRLVRGQMALPCFHFPPDKKVTFPVFYCRFDSKKTPFFVRKLFSGAFLGPRVTIFQFSGVGFGIKSAIKNGESYLFVWRKVKTRECHLSPDQPRSRSSILREYRTSRMHSTEGRRGNPTNVKGSGVLHC